jgi:hypothetical protein
VAEEQRNNNIVFTASEHRGLIRNSWLLDSAASVHITNNKSIFSSYIPLDNHNIVGIGSKPAEGQRPVQLQFKVGSKLTTVTLQRVLYLPTSPYNLISLGKLHRAGHKIHSPLQCSF